jgi:pilus assembly protein CpaB
MNQRLKIAVIAAVVFGFIAAYGTYNFLRQQKAATEAMKKASQNVVVAAKDVPAGTTIDEKAIKAGMLKEVAWPKASVPAGSFVSTQQLVGKIVKVKTVAGEPILQSRISGEGMGLTVRLSAGYRAMSVKVDEIIGVSGFIAPDDRVDVIATVAAPGKNSHEEKMSKIVLQDKRVLSVAQNVEQKEGKAQVARSITLEVTPDEAERLSLVQLEGQTILALRAVGDEKLVQTRGSTTRDLLAVSAAPKNGNVSAVAPAKHRVELYLGNKKSVAEF